MEQILPLDAQDLTPEQLVDKEYASRLKTDLNNITSVLTEAYKTLGQVEKRNMVVAVGNTACGKSTMLTSLIYGPDKLESKELVEERKNLKGQITLKKSTVIDQKETFKLFMQQQDKQNEFKIGHSAAKSMTFLPHFQYAQEHDTVFADIAGLHDTDGDLIDYVNCFVNKKIFNIANKISFIVPFTQTQLRDARGKHILSHIHLILALCTHNRYKELIEAIQPVMTKCPIPDPEEDDDEDGVDLEEIQSTLYEHFKKDLQNRKNQDGFVDPETTSSAIDQQNQDLDQDASKQEEYFAELDEFYRQFAYKTIIYDPLDREIMYEDQDQATKRDQFMKLILDQTPIHGLALQLPISNQKHSDLLKIFDQKKNQCLNIVQKHIDEAKEKGNGYNKDLTQEVEIIKLQESMGFFARHNLLPDAAKRSENFKQEIQTQYEMCQKEKLYKENSKLGQFVIDQYRDMIERSYEKNYVALCKILISIKNKVDELEEQNAPEIEDQKQTMKKDMTDMMVSISDDLFDLICFCFELRKQDTPDDKYSKALLDDLKINDQPFNKTLHYKIIMSNYWDSQKESMMIKEGVKFGIKIGANLEYTLRCEVTNGQREVPIVVKPVDIEALQKQEQEMQNSGFLTRLIKRMQNMPQSVNEYIKEKVCQGQDNFQFLLTYRGIEIFSADSGKKFMTKNNQVRQGTYQRVVQNRFDNINWNDPRMNSFSIVPKEPYSTDISQNLYHIEMPYGERRPRLVMNNKNAAIWSRLICTTRISDGYREDPQSLWQIVQV